MNISRVKRAAVGFGAALVTAALVAVPAVSANAAVTTTVGSDRPLYLLSEEDGSGFPAGTVRYWSDSVLASPVSSDPTYDHPFTVPANASSVRSFIAPRGQERNKKAWNASAPSAWTSAGYLLPNLKLSGQTSAELGTPSGSSAVATVGGDYSLGFAYFDWTGNTVVEANYTYITVVPNANPSLSTFTFDVPVAATPKPDFSAFSATANASAVVGATSVAFDATSANANKQADVWLEGASAKAASLTLDASGKATYSSITGLAAGTRVALTAKDSAPASVLAWITAAGVAAPTQPTDQTNAATKVTVADITAPATQVTVPAGAANANKTFTAWGWSTPTSLGQVTTDANGNATVNVASLPAGSHTVALTDPNTGAIAAWGTFTISSATQGSTNVSAAVTNTGKFALEGTAASVNLTPVSAVKRGETTAAVNLGQFTVTDDRNALLGWTLKADATDFVSGSNTIAKSALGIAPTIVSGVTDGITLGSAQLAGAAVYPVAKLAEAAAGKGTLAVGTALDAALTFKAPSDAVAGTYTSTLTLTLTSK